ncbi:NADH dehydrogenase [ubiquinone] 1 beta subcomplex subunit 2, mitochondrial-like [Onthophagus taurus]|uniref:NADH dehydrogenase [ubiquinone] 1 beta subcomplex subunit 2, mitochondrial-like n=1 Tax=Onthophagus taurus TaxID=166361 RepID=UPI000C1FFC77|nr:NADH dehydrogenase [ubiquinone] 1 beta subcomplex subunit 2, mitochondrial-like [Onthophagus taurus]
MLASRGAQILKLGKLLVLKPGNFTQAVRHGHGQWVYRTTNPHIDKRLIICSQAIMGFAWWWMLWHIVTEPGHILGEFEYPDANKWTDEELGIPSD